MSSKHKTYRIIKYSSIDAGFHLVAASLLAWASYRWLTVVDAYWLRILIGVAVALPFSITIRPILVPLVYVHIAIFRAIMSIIRKELKL